MKAAVMCFVVLWVCGFVVPLAVAEDMTAEAVKAADEAVAGMKVVDSSEEYLLDDADMNDIAIEETNAQETSDPITIPVATAAEPSPTM